MEAAFEKVVDILFGVAIRQISYMWNYTQNIDTLKTALRDLKGTRERVQGQINIAIRRGNNLFEGVENWMKDAHEVISKADEFVEEEANAKKTCLKLAMCGNWHTLHHYGRRAAKMAPCLLQQQVSGTRYESCVSVETPAPGPLDVYQNKDLDDLHTHNSALEDIMGALEDESKQIIGVYGLGGVGKTTLAKEVAARVRKNNWLFAEVAFTTVSQKVDFEKINKDIGEATKRIMKGDKILIILDDVWEKLNLEELCIPVNHTNCKILLTSRSERVCQKMNAQSNICVNSLPTKEAWILFKRVVGERVETDAELKPVAEEVAKECGGLPLLIQAVGSALKHERIDSWKTALSGLKEHAPSEIDPDIQKAFTRLQLSYNYLESEVAKSCFLLCSMFPEDFDISLETLVYYMVGLHKFDDLESMEEARHRVRNAVNMLTSSCLLLDVEDDERYTKMHDVVRDVAREIASREINNKYLVKAGKDLTEWQARENNLRDYRGISLMRNMISKLPDYEVHLPILDIFLINENWELSMISDEFIKGMKEVKVLDLSRCPNAQLPQSLELLTKLRMLNLEGNKFFHDLSLLGEMKDLEILILNRTRIEEIHEEIVRLVNLRRLELIGCKEMTHVTPGVISKLRSLEELCIDFSRMREGVKGCIAEVIKLSKLTYLDLTVNTFDEISEFIIAALEDESKQIIGIYGLWGVGKTTFAKEVVTKVKHLFVDITFITISQSVKIEEIKKFVENATKRIVKGEKVLIILDDVWDKLDLEELCILVNHTNCKILLTSRSEKVCQKMKAQVKICVNSLPTKEAWILFKRVVGERVETDAELKPVAEEVAKECGGLPLLIQAVGSALKHESIDSWKTALSGLKEHAPLEIDRDIQKAFTHLQLSYNYLESEVAKSCFLLCSMFPEDFDISLETLVYYMVGLHKFDDLESMEEARDRVRNAVNMLTSSCLLLDVKDDESYTKMHDVVRDVARQIASRDINNKYLVQAGKDLTEWQARENNLRDYRGISLMRNMISKLPDCEVHLPILDIFLINENWELSMISDEFIKGMKEVKVLDLSRCPNAQLPQSLELLTKLRMLNLEGNKFFHDLSLLGEMKELDILNINGTGIKEIHNEIGRLVNLRRLELVGCKEMTHVTPGVISKLRSLEELCIDFSRMREGVKGCIAEVMMLSKLTYLDLTVNNFDEISEFISTKYLENMKRYVIKIPFSYAKIMLSRSDRYLSISFPQVSHLPRASANGCDIQLLKLLEKMIELIRNPHIRISGIDMINNIIPTLNINKLERIDVRECPNVTCLVDDGTKRFFKELKHIELYKLSRLEVLWKCPDEYISLTKLVTLSISDCDKLESLFTVSIAQSLVNLKKLYIHSCPCLHKVIWGGDDKSGNIIVFPSLAEISLLNLRRLGSFHSGATENCRIEYPSLVDVRIDDWLKMDIWGPGIHVTPKLKSISVVKFGNNVAEFQLDGPNALNDAMKHVHETFLKQQNKRGRR